MRSVLDNLPSPEGSGDWGSFPWKQFRRWTYFYPRQFKVRRVQSKSLAGGGGGMGRRWKIPPSPSILKDPRITVIELSLRGFIIDLIIIHHAQISKIYGEEGSHPNIVKLTNTF